MKIIGLLAFGVVAGQPLFDYWLGTWNILLLVLGIACLVLPIERA